MATLGEKGVVEDDVVLAAGIEIVEAGEAQLVATSGKEITTLVQGKTGNRLIQRDDIPRSAAPLRFFLKVDRQHF